MIAVAIFKREWILDEEVIIILAFMYILGYFWTQLFQMLIFAN